VPGIESRTETLTPDSLRKLNFYQFKARTARFFFELLGRCSVQIVDTPHYSLATALHSGDAEEIARAAAFYRAYLSASWNLDETDNSITQRLGRFQESFLQFKRTGFKVNPTIISLPTDSDYYVVDGNHRISFAAALDQAQKVDILRPDEAFLKFNRVKEFYGTGNKNMPYQSLYLNGQEVIAGRRRDLVDRLSMIPPEVILGKSVLDLASNVGMSSILARSFGANFCLGLEYSAAMVDIASRFAMISGEHPAVLFRQYNIDTDALPGDQKFDTAFMFSIHDHLKNPSRLTDIVANNVRSYVVFEGHPGDKAKKYAEFFKSDLFESVSEIGRLHTSRSRQDESRLLWLCKKR
jgi:hypothetical protein